MEQRRPALHAMLLALGLAMGWLVVLAANPHLIAPADGVSSAQARRWLADDPLDVSALRALGLALYAEGRPGSADAVLTFAGQRSWRDLETDRWLFERRLIEGRLPEAFAEADAMLRLDIDESLRAPLIHVVVLTLGDKTAQTTLAQHLAGSPWWRLDFMRRLDADGSEDDARAVLLELAKTPAPPTPDEYAPYIRRMVKRGAYRQAWSDWRWLARPGAALDRADIEGGFAPFDGTPFTWNGADGAGATSSIESGTLRIEYDGYGEPTLPGRMLVLPAGRYSLSWREHHESDVASRVGWVVTCVGGSPMLAQSAPTSSASWAARSLNFEVPRTGCPAERLGLVPLPGDRRSDGVSWFQAPSVVRLRAAT